MAFTKKEPQAAPTKNVRLTVVQVPVTYSEDDNGYVLDMDDVPVDEQWKVLDFTETWQNESGILTVVITNG